MYPNGYESISEPEDLNEFTKNSINNTNIQNTISEEIRKEENINNESKVDDSIFDNKTETLFENDKILKSNDTSIDNEQINIQDTSLQNEESSHDNEFIKKQEKTITEKLSDEKEVFNHFESFDKKELKRLEYAEASFASSNIKQYKKFPEILESIYEFNEIDDFIDIKELIKYTLIILYKKVFEDRIEDMYQKQIMILLKFNNLKIGNYILGVKDKKSNFLIKKDENENAESIFIGLANDELAKIIDSKLEYGATIKLANGLAMKKKGKELVILHSINFLGA